MIKCCLFKNDFFFLFLFLIYKHQLLHSNPTIPMPVILINNRLYLSSTYYFFKGVSKKFLYNHPVKLTECRHPHFIDKGTEGPLICSAEVIRMRVLLS